MSRLSYGGGMFSPLRCDTSLNDGVFVAQRESDIFDQWKDICVERNLDENTEVFFKENKEEKKDDSITTEKPNGSLCVNKHQENLSTSSDSSKGKLSHVTTRRKTSQSKQTLTSAPKEDKTNRKKESLSKYISVRSENGKQNEFRLSKSRLSNNCYATPSLPSLTEEHIGMKYPEIAHTSESKMRNVVSVQYDAKKLGNTTDRKVKKTNPLASPKELTSNRSEKCLTVECEVQTDLLMSEFNSTSSKTLGDSVSHSYQPTSISNLPISCKPQQIQANIIEKVVKDAVSFEFDGIRQMLYHQQWSIYKYVDKRLEAERKVSSLLAQYNEELMEENKRLREEVTAYQNFFKV